MNTGLSSSGIKKLVTTLNEAAKSPMVEPNFQSKFLQFGRQLSDFFTQKFLSDSFIRASGNKCQTKQITVVHCKNFSHFQDEI